MASESITERAHSRTIRSAVNSRFTDLKIHGKDNIFRDCPLEALLQQRARDMALSGEDVTDEALQQQACDIIESMHAQTPNSSELFASLLVAIVKGSTGWLGPFRQRAGLDLGLGPYLLENAQPSVEDVAVIEKLSAAREDGSLETATSGPSVKAGGLVDALILDPNLSSDWHQSSNVPADGMHQPATAFLDDRNSYRRLVRELTRYVASSTSERNPSRYVPTDLDLQHQARWIMYDEYVWPPLPSFRLYVSLLTTT